VLSKKKNKNDIIYEKLSVPTSEREGKLSNPRARPASVMHEENLRKFTEPARRPRALCSNFLVAKNTVDRRVLHPRRVLPCSMCVTSSSKYGRVHDAPTSRYTY
jgi:hypothetical protein